MIIILTSGLIIALLMAISLNEDKARNTKREISRISQFNNKLDSLHLEAEVDSWKEEVERLNKELENKSND